MTVVKLMGGLGNQMFQYATARRIAWRNKSVLKLDLSTLQGEPGSDTPRRFELHHLSITAQPASPSEIAGLTMQAAASRESVLGHLLQKLGLRPLPVFYRERHFHFDRAVLRMSDNSYLEGYWQSEKYFADIKELILTEFSFKHPLSGMNLQLAQSMQTTSSVSLHIRRGDYVSSSAITAFHGTCSLQYYLNAAAKIASEVPAPHFFVFSDDTEWVKEHLLLPYTMTMVEHNGPDAGHEDMRLMSMCRHHIIANSSFSWWGAWLNPRPDKIVIAPSRWFNDPSVDTGDLLPASWLRMAT